MANNGRPCDRSKDHNKRCERCEHWSRDDRDVRVCTITGEPKKYYNRCRDFGWKVGKNYIN